VTIASGTKLGRYDIRSQPGAGAMGEVYLAQDTRESSTPTPIAGVGLFLHVAPARHSSR